MSADKYDPNIHHRRSIRLHHWDYSRPGAYFLTICVHGRLPLFGHIATNDMQLNPAGHMVKECWEAIPTLYHSVTLDSFIIMPDHLHGILLFDGPPYRNANNQPVTLADIISAFKTYTMRRYTHGVDTDHWPPYENRLWQRNYYEHIIRTDTELHQIRHYIATNPARRTPSA